ncbi:30S ribosomal protein S4 [Sedimentisphaera salicampi]|uniref:Small ribosomal subunit protein uS4 n=1 Tax=Sedimentisphaera salicampi TaxID=1941349 RepID=A0A1W6LJT2_9BACT|nr:30S ribosomal protein S4 [Sedimentisphaera salicampi]ARN56012.1 30S ribosomal protein S4 [Sedimentisphaera salicampi]OXU15925.1 30S ribosomal protein S4 [Sedimentisphaera salicampi]
MGNYTGPKVKLSRALGVPVAETPKHVSPKKTNRPGAHGYRRQKPTLYGVQLKEKQKIAYYYNVKNNQLRRYMKLAESSKDASDKVFQTLLETRLDNVVRRLRWARTIWQARQMVSHAHFRLNGRRVDIPSVRVKPGDVIEVKERSKKFVQQAAEEAGSLGLSVPEWIASDTGNMKASITRLPEFDEVRLPFDVDFSKIIEFYTL